MALLPIFENSSAFIEGAFNFIFPPFFLKLINTYLFIPRYLWAGVRIRPYSKLHLGCGVNILKDGWANIDLLRSYGVIRWDCTKRLPVRSSSIAIIFSEHFIEHMNREQGRKFFAECYRVLQPSGILRITTPDLKSCIDEYLKGDASKLRNVKHKYNTGKSYSSCCMMNDVMHLWGHQFIYDPDELQKILKEVGFLSVTKVAWRESTHKELMGRECRPFNDEIIVEVVK